MPMIIITSVALLIVLWLASEPLLVELRRRRIRREPFPAEWREILRARVPYFRVLPADLQLQLKKHMQVFLAEKTFIGCAGLEVTMEMRVTVAAQACLLLLNRRAGYFRNLRQILIYPGAFIVDRVQTDGNGVLQDQRQVLAGESWTQGQVILSWDDTLDGAAVIDDGRNVVIHEFAHQLDQEKGHANGAPYLSHRSRYKRWAQVLNTEFEKLQAQADSGEPSLFSYYGATNPAEFFAVTSEVFFERPQEMAAHYPELYRELSEFYRVNPLSWS
ncbi:M90 family metallopeptidase [Uliginosibacterium sp. H3]|uniref:M90 family metallopeptidase n=1 Tax=Uliginosibacterium silvisoli TaxID=3114758 RepID=A0ABU6JXX2_9RHOO|nr:M90 family metallopeptidase [Uliginosibacterium sp. H3]